jgi:hypothetical protein
MNPSTVKPPIIPSDENEPAAPSLRGVVRRSALLNVVIVRTSFPVLVLAQGPRAVVPSLAVMAGVSGLVWTATFARFSFASLARIFRAPASPGKRREPPRPAGEAGVVDRWLDGRV